MKRYKYLVQHNLESNELNHFGAIGWELVAAVAYKSESGSNWIKYVFKKEI